MSLLDDVSIVVTPNGYKAGELYAVMPTFALGSELVNNSIFNSDNTSDWGNGFYDSFTFDSSEGGFYNLQRVAADARTNINLSSVLTVGKRYKVTVVARGSGNIKTGLTASSYSTQPSAVFTLTSSFASYSTVVTVTSGLVYGVLWNDDGNSDIDYQSYSVKEYTSADMDVTRATAATRVDENGLVNYAEVIGGEEIEDGNFPLPNTEWTVDSEWNISSNKANYDNTGTGSIVQNITFDSSKEYKIKFSISGFTTSHRFDIYTGVSYIKTSTTDSETSYTIYFQGDGGTYIRFRGLSTESFSLSNVSVKEVTRDNVPRIDYTGGGCPHILAEPMRTNFVTTSASGTYGSAPASEILAIAPDGENTAIRPVPSTSSNRYQETIAGGTYSSGDEVTYSWYRKRFSTPVVDSYVGDLFINALVNCTQVGVTTEIISDVNGFNRVSATFSITDGSIDSILRFYFGSIIGTGNSSVAYWGHQLEAGSYATSYIPTSGSTVTRNQDIFTRDGIGSLINSTEGVLFVEMAAFASDSTDKRISLGDGTSSNRIVIGYNAQDEIQIFFAGTTGSFTPDYVIDITQDAKVAVSWSSTKAKFYVNGSPILETLGDFSFAADTLTELSFDNGIGTLTFFGKARQLQVYTTALTDPQLAALTS